MTTLSSWKYNVLPGCRVYAVTVDVDQNGEWLQAIADSAPETQPRKHVHDVAAHYPPHEGVVRKTLVFLNNPNGLMEWTTAVGWSLNVGLRATTPRDIFAVSKSVPRLNEEFRLQKMRIIATMPCIYMQGSCACWVTYDGGARIAGLPYTTHCTGSECWFGFVE